MKRYTSFLFPKSSEFWFLIILLLLLACALALGFMAWQQPERLGLVAESASRQSWISSSFTAAAILALLTLSSVFVLHKAGSRMFDDVLDETDGDDIARAADEKKSPASPAALMVKAIRHHLHSRYGLFWRRKVRLLLVVGDDAAREA
ncbi:hypothetical protein ACFL9S_22875 [Erwinia sp. AnSW2-5]|uniref:hypothetical protein n=1 Tax=Erwinia sp. AnSW2-5 TaxID=3367692 RepID=UPI00385EB008